jgi:hypothetical protein
MHHAALAAAAAHTALHRACVNMVLQTCSGLLVPYALCSMAQPGIGMLDGWGL